MHRSLRRAVHLALAGLLALPALAHEFWIQPAQYRPDRNAVLGVHLRVGDGFPGEIRQRDPSKLVDFYIIGPDGKRDIPGTDGRDPAGLARLNLEGVHVIAYTGKPSFITLEAAKFESYLKDEGLESISTERAAAGESAKEGKEAFRRCAKALVCCEKPNAAEVWKKPLGLALEIMPEADPYTLAPGSKATFVVLEDGKPVEGALVRATAQKKPAQWQAVRTDSQGRVELSLEESGVFLVNCVRMKREFGKDTHDWLSTWSSLTFEVPGPDTKHGTK